MSDNKENDSYIKPPVKMLTKDLTENYIQEIVKEAAKRVLKDKENADKLDQAWNSTSEQDKEKYLQDLEEKIAKKIQDISTNEQDILREVSDILQNDFDLTKIQNLSQKPSKIGCPSDSEAKTRDDEPSLCKRLLRSYWTKGFLGLIFFAAVIYLAVHIIFPPQLSLNTTSLDFGTIGEGKPSPLSFAIINTGKVELKWNANADQPWIVVYPSSGTNAGVVRVSILQGSLQPGDQKGIIDVKSNAGDQQVNVRLHAQTPPEPGVNPKSLDFVKIGRSQPASKVLSISNSGEIPLHWTASADVSWITLSRNKGTNNGDILIGIVGYQAPGIYKGNITVQSNASSLIVPISLDVRRPPHLTVLPTPMIFNFEELLDDNVSLPKPKSMIIRNDGGDVLNWKIDQDDWISVDASSGSLQPNAEKVVMVGIKPNLEPRNSLGNQSGNLSIISNGGEAKGTVELKRIETKAPIAVALLPRSPLIELLPRTINATAATPASQPIR